jgi:hypothetical protein
MFWYDRKHTDRISSPDLSDPLGRTHGRATERTAHPITD